MKTLVIIPCYNEAPNIEQVLGELRQAMPEADYLVVNDCSTDASEEILRRGGHSHLTLPVNLGIGGGVQSGYLYAAQHGYDVTVQMDGDGQHLPEYLPVLIGPVASGKCDMCIGSRFIMKEGFQTSAMRRLGIRILSGLIRLLTGARTRDVTSGFRACNKALTAFYAEHYAQDFPEPEAIISAVTAGFTVGEVPVVMRERQGGESSISPLIGAYYMVKVALSLLVYRLILKKGRREPTC